MDLPIFSLVGKDHRRPPEEKKVRPAMEGRTKKSPGLKNLETILKEAQQLDRALRLDFLSVRL